MGGYKEGCVSKSKRPRCKSKASTETQSPVTPIPAQTPTAIQTTVPAQKMTTTGETKDSEERPSNYPDRPLRKYPTSTPVSATQTRKRLEEILQQQPELSLDSPNASEIDRARSVRPTTSSEVVQPAYPQQQPAQQQPAQQQQPIQQRPAERAEEAVESTQDILMGDDDVVPASQVF